MTNLIIFTNLFMSIESTHTHTQIKISFEWIFSFIFSPILFHKLYAHVNSFLQAYITIEVCRAKGGKETVESVKICFIFLNLSSSLKSFARANVQKADEDLNLNMSIDTMTQASQSVFECCDLVEPLLKCQHKITIFRIIR